MKYKKELAVALSCFLLSFLCFMVWQKGESENLANAISPAILRLHVIGASNSSKDQRVKLQVKSFVLEQLSDLCASSKEDLVTQIKNHQMELTSQIQDFAAERLKTPTDVDLRLCRTFFPKKSYGDLTFPQGMYDALEIRLGAARGRNWWCVLYPRLCFLDLTHAVVPDSSKEELASLLGDEVYTQLLNDENVRLKIQPDILKYLRSIFTKDCAKSKESSINPA